ncbi:MAG TPA: methyltransferase domain-containing protein [Rhodanobacteraceae bacterium]|nr:methyltransferase domain-containing protein [Rhodanobacteraceae bacterium]
MSGIAELSVLESEFARAGGTELTYLRAHYARFAATKREYDRTRDAAPGVLLDVGSHWLHQSLLWALDGWSVVAMDLPLIADVAMVRDLAALHSIRLLPNRDLQYPEALASLADDSVDLVLFTEIIEHITFNPVAMWRAIHRVLRPGGTIVVTTPNYYALRGRAWAPLRFLGGRGGGLAVESLIGEPTFAHHWKEYSLKELARYFELLSADFRVARALHRIDYQAHAFRSIPGRAYMAIERALPLVRPQLHVEIALPEKRHGVIADASW